MCVYLVLILSTCRTRVVLQGIIHACNFFFNDNVYKMILHVFSSWVCDLLDIMKINLSNLSSSNEAYNWKYTICFDSFICFFTFFKLNAIQHRMLIIFLQICLNWHIKDNTLSHKQGELIVESKMCFTLTLNRKMCFTLTLNRKMSFTLTLNRKMCFTLTLNRKMSFGNV